MTQSVMIPDYDSWYPLEEVMARTGMSKRTIYRKVADGELRQASRPIPGRKPLPVFEPDGVDVLVASVLKAMPQILPPAPMMPQSDIESRAPMPQYDIMPVAQSLSQSLEAIATRIDAHFALWLDEDAAVRYSGLGLHYLRTAVEWRRIGPRGARVCRRVDLDKL